jgi:integrase
MRRRVSGWIQVSKGKLYAVIDYQQDGKRIQKRRRAANRKDAKSILKEWEKEANAVAVITPPEITPPEMTYDKLMEHYKEDYAKPPVYAHGRKIDGMKCWQAVRSFLKPTEKFFKKIKLKNITYELIHKYKLQRLKQKAKVVGAGKKHVDSNRTVSIALVNRELSFIRAMLNVAVKKGWISSNPFNAGKPLIVVAHENTRERVVTLEEEKRLLDGCGARRQHLKAFIMLSLDSGMRQGEIMKLKVRDLHFDLEYIDVIASNTKTEKYRMVPLSPRVAVALQERVQDMQPNERPFPYQKLNHSFARLRKEVGLPDITIHSLRHTYATRLAKTVLNPAIVGKTLGHSELTTTYKYIHQDLEMVRMAAKAIEAYRKQNENEDKESEP